jgi:nickel-dependent lactate racemase
MSNKIKLPQGAWFNEREIIITFPTDWQIEVCDSLANKINPLSDNDIKKVFANPIGARTIRETARGKKEVGIVFDDITRGTRVYQLVPYVLEELAQAGINSSQIRFICALGSHGAHTLIDFTKKLGEPIVAKYPVFNHNPFENCKYLGQTSRGTKVSVNAELMKCDLKIGIGCIVPHPMCGYGGGCKIILPGVSSIETIIKNHTLSSSNANNTTNTNDQCADHINPVDVLGTTYENIELQDIKEACRLVRLDFIIDALVNYKCETVDLVVGDPIKAYQSGVKIAKKIYGTSFTSKAEIVVANANFKNSEAVLALAFGIKSLKPGGDIVVIFHTPMGQVTHYTYGSFGRYTGGKLWNPGKALTVDNAGKVILFNPYRNYADEYWFGGYEMVNWASTWKEVMELLSPGRGPGTSVNVFTDATIQYYIGK